MTPEQETVNAVHTEISALSVGDQIVVQTKAKELRAMLKAGALAAHHHTASQRQDLDVVLGAGQAPQLLRHLFRQFARRAEHQRLHIKARNIQLR